MTISGLVFYCLVASMLGSALVGVIVARRGPALVGSFLVCMFSLAGIFAIIDAHLLAVAQLLMSMALGLLLYFTNGLLSGFAAGGGDLRGPGRWRWLVAMMGVGAAGGFGLVLFRLSGEVPADLPVPLPAAGVSPALAGSRALGISMFGDYAIAVVGIGLLLLTAVIGAGYMGRRGLG